MSQDRIIIHGSRSNADTQRQLEKQIVLKKEGKVVSSGREHPIWQFNPQYAEEVVFKHEPIQIISTRTDVLKVVGFPLTQAALLLSDLGIHMEDSSPHIHPDMNATKISHFAYIDIHADSLSNENRQVAGELLRNGQAMYLDAAYHFYEAEPNLMVYRLFVPIQQNTTAEMVEEQFMEIVSSFRNQN